MTEAAMMDIFQQGCLCTNIFTLCAVYFLRSWNEDGEKKTRKKNTINNPNMYFLNSGPIGQDVFLLSGRTAWLHLEHDP